jgi:hypothetical protein
MEFYVEGEAPDGEHLRTPYRGWQLAASRAPEGLGFDLLISDKSAGAR